MDGRSVQQAVLQIAEAHAKAKSEGNLPAASVVFADSVGEEEGIARQNIAQRTSRTL